MGYQPGTRDVVQVQEIQMEAMTAMHDAHRALRRRDYPTSRRAIARGQRHLRAANRKLRNTDPIAAAFAAARIGRSPRHR